MKPFPTTPVTTAIDLLPGATFADAFSIDLDELGLDAVGAADRAFSSAPPWIVRLLAVRDAVVRPFGLKGAKTARASTVDRIGMFPCLSRTPGRVVMGLNDAHLDFRLAVDVTTLQGHTKRFTATTVVKPHNLLGRLYLASILPFHKMIVPAMLARVQRP